MYFLDTNIFLEWLLGRPHAADCQRLFAMLEENKLQAAASKFSIYSICIFLCKAKNFGEARNFLSFLSSLETLEILTTDETTEFAAIDVAEKFGLDFDDALQLALARLVGADAIVSFDRDFDKTPLKRVEPATLL